MTDFFVTTLSKRQREAIIKLAARSGSAYALSISLATLYALQRESLVVGKHRLGSVAMPRTHIDWSLTKAGKQVRLAMMTAVSLT